MFGKFRPLHTLRLRKAVRVAKMNIRPSRAQAILLHSDMHFVPAGRLMTDTEKHAISPLYCLLCEDEGCHSVGWGNALRAALAKVAAS